MKSTVKDRKLQEAELSRPSLFSFVLIGTSFFLNVMVCS